MSDTKSSIFRCPRCGAALSVTQSGGAMRDASWTERTFQPMGYGDVAAADTLREFSRTTPHRAASRESEVRVPLQQAAITAGAIALPAAVLTAIGGWPVYVPLVVGTGSFAVAWFWLLRDSRGLLRVVERVVNRDIDNDGRIGDEPAEPKSGRVRLEVREQRDGGVTMRFLDVPIDEARLRDFARGILMGRPFSERAWAGDGKPFSQNDFAALRDKLIETGFARWKGGQRRMGAELTAKGRAMFSGLAGDPTPPPRQ